MAVNGRILFNSGERLDVPDLVAGPSFVGADFKYLLNGMVGTLKPYIVKGFDVIDPASSIGSNSISIQVADSSVFCPSNTTGAFYHGLEEGNANAEPLVPVLRKNATNYVYLTLTTENRARDLRVFWDPDANDSAGAEFTQDVNTQTAMVAQVNVSTSTFPSEGIPVCKVVYGSSSITSIQDCRNLLFRLGTGGPNPDAQHAFEFRNVPSSTYARADPTQVMTSTSSPNAFQGGDKNIRSLKEWMDIVMTRFMEISGGTHWYSSSTRDGVKLVYGPLVSLTDNFVWTSGTSTLEWESLAITFDNSEVYFNNITDDSAVLSVDGQCLYVDIDRTDDATPLTAAVDDLLNLGTSGRAGSRLIIAWSVDGEIYTRDRAYEVGRNMSVATTSADGVVRLNLASHAPLAPIVSTVDASGRVVGSGLTRGALAAGVLALGNGANDSSVSLSKSGAATAVLGNLTVAESAVITGTLQTTQALTVSSGGAAITGTVAVTGAQTVSAGITATQSTLNGNAITATGNGTGKAVSGTSSSAGGIGIYGTALDGNGVEGNATSSGSGGRFTGALGATGLEALSTSTGPAAIITAAGGSGTGARITGNATRSALKLVPQAAPSEGEIGDIYVTAAGVLKICTVAGTPGTWVSVGAQV